MSEGRDPLVWGAARMIRVAVECAGRSEECLARAKVIGDELRRALREEGLSTSEIDQIVVKP